MEVHFRRTGERRYAVTIDREDLPVVEMNPAPGYDPLIPHDLMHLVVERELGLTRGIFGQVANGGTAGSFQIVPTREKKKRDLVRQRRRNSKRGEKLLRAGREECIKSERATWICWYEWLNRSDDPTKQKRAMEMAEVNYLSGHKRKNTDAINKDVIDRVCARLDDLSARWSQLGIGESLTVEWP